MQDDLEVKVEDRTRDDIKVDIQDETKVEENFDIDANSQQNLDLEVGEPVMVLIGPKSKKTWRKGKIVAGEWSKSKSKKGRREFNTEVEDENKTIKTHRFDLTYRQKTDPTFRNEVLINVQWDDTRKVCRIRRSRIQKCSETEQRDDDVDSIYCRDKLSLREIIDASISYLAQNETEVSEGMSMRQKAVKQFLRSELKVFENQDIVL